MNGDIVVVAAAGVLDNVGVLMCCWIVGGMLTEVTTRALGSCSLTRIYCYCPRQGHLMTQRKKYVDSLFLLPLVSFC